MGILDKIKQDVKKSGQSKGKFIYFREGEKKRVRFLDDMDEGKEIVFHDSFQRGINVPCQEMYGKDCPYCEDEDLRTRSLYAWSVYDYEAKEVKILMQAVNNCTAVPALMALYETYGTLLDRDFVITKSGKGQNTTFAVVPMDKNKFRNEKAKPLSMKSLLKYLAQAYPADDADESEGDDDNEDDDTPMKKSKVKTKTKVKDDYDDEEEDDWNEGDDDGEQVDYSDMSAKELYKLCKERNLDVLPKKSEKYYIKQLQEDDQAHDDWDNEEDDWDDEE